MTMNVKKCQAMSCDPSLNFNYPNPKYLWMWLHLETEFKEATELQGH